ncbi:methylated-DNA--[protein]-cysteine S-methyltransferase [Edaphobacter modestus]|nr:MGMT family protein [Edaphobacter modestus]
MLRDTPYGETRSYGQLADALGNREAIRAVGLANGKNPISIVIPCHRVLGSDGSLTGYAGGLDRKRFLLEMEGARGFQPDQAFVGTPFGTRQRYAAMVLYGLHSSPKEPRLLSRDLKARNGVRIVGSVVTVVMSNDMSRRGATDGDHN